VGKQERERVERQKRDVKEKADKAGAGVPIRRKVDNGRNGINQSKLN